MQWFKNLFQKDETDYEDTPLGEDSTTVPDEMHSIEQMTMTEALEEVLRRLDTIHQKINKMDKWK